MKKHAINLYKKNPEQFYIKLMVVSLIISDVWNACQLSIHHNSATINLCSALHTEMSVAYGGNLALLFGKLTEAIFRPYHESESWKNTEFWEYPGFEKLVQVMFGMCGNNLFGMCGNNFWIINWLQVMYSVHNSSNLDYPILLISARVPKY